MTGPNRELARQMQQRNRRYLAAVQHWPAGALEACVKLDSEHAGWVTFWRPANTMTGFEKPAGFHAVRHPDGAEVFAATPAEVSTGIEQTPPPRTDI